MACRSGRLGHANASAMPPSKTPHSARPPRKMPIFTKNRKMGDPLLGGGAFLEEFCDMLIAAILRVSADALERGYRVSVTNSFSVVSGQLAGDGIMRA